MKYHEPVLLNETLDFLKVVPGEKYIDCTLGDAGHTVEILKLGGFVLGLDYNQESLQRAQQRIESEHLQENFTGVLANFRDVEDIAVTKKFTDVSGILFDLGYSSTQLEDALGLAFKQDQPLDMRLDKTLGVTAADLLNSLSATELTRMFREYGEETRAKIFAEVIVNYRNLKKLESTKELADLIASTVSPGYDRIHPATRVFQALRIVVNDELENFKISLPRAARLLKLPGGRMLTISFHSLEDRMAKRFGQVRPKDNNVNYTMELITKKPILPSDEEIRRNKRSRSAKLRVFEKNFINEK